MAEEVDLIAAAEHLPAIVALELGSCLLARSAAGMRRTRRILGARLEPMRAPRRATPRRRRSDLPPGV